MVDGDDYSNKNYSLTVYDFTNDNILSEGESFELPAEILMEFISSMEVQYDFTNVYSWYTDNNGKKLVSWSGDAPVTQKALISHTKDEVLPQ